MKFQRLVRPLVLLMPLVLSACANLQTAKNTPTLDENAIAENLLYTLSTLDEVSPWQTAVQVSQPNTEFGEHVEAGLVELGYAVRRVSADQGQHYVRYASEQVHNETGEFIRYRVAIGNISVERFYDLDGAVTYPVSAITVTGATVQDVSINDDIFDDIFKKHDSTVSSASFIRGDGGDNVQLADNSASTNSVPTRSYINEPTGINESSFDSSSSEATGGLNVAAAATLDTATKQNMYESGGHSNFASVFVNYDDVKRVILEFPNDSLYLDEDIRDIIARYANSIRSDEYVISLIGCSHGKSDLNNGNRLLALGRANRVKEELLSVGVKDEQVLDEGCWAPVHFDEKMPRRGVVMTLKRPKA